MVFHSSKRTRGLLAGFRGHGTETPWFFARALGDHAWSITALRRYGPDWDKVGWMELLIFFGRL